MTELEKKKGWLLEAELARHKLALGKTTVEFEINGIQKKYARNSINELDKYIQTLRAEISKLEPKKRRRPIYFH